MNKKRNKGDKRNDSIHLIMMTFFMIVLMILLLITLIFKRETPMPKQLDSYISQLPEPASEPDWEAIFAASKTFDPTGFYIGGATMSTVFISMQTWLIKTTNDNKQKLAVVKSVVDRNREDIKLLDKQDDKLMEKITGGK